MTSRKPPRALGGETAGADRGLEEGIAGTDTDRVPLDEIAETDTDTDRTLVNESTGTDPAPVNETVERDRAPVIGMRNTEQPATTRSRQPLNCARRASEELGERCGILPARNRRRLPKKIYTLVLRMTPGLTGCYKSGPPCTTKSLTLPKRMKCSSFWKLRLQIKGDNEGRTISGVTHRTINE